MAKMKEISKRWELSSECVCWLSGVWEMGEKEIRK